MKEHGSEYVTARVFGNAICQGPVDGHFAVACIVISISDLEMWSFIVHKMGLMGNHRVTSHDETWVEGRPLGHGADGLAGPWMSRCPVLHSTGRVPR